MLSYAYSLLTRTWVVTLSAVGFDPYRGFYHQPRYGRPALALDLMEPFRPLIADSVVLQAMIAERIPPSRKRRDTALPVAYPALQLFYLLCGSTSATRCFLSSDCSVARFRRWFSSRRLVFSDDH